MTDPKIKYKEILSKYIPELAVDTMADWILHFNFNLKITENRTSKLGDYRHPFRGERHIITINHNLNHYSFLITLVHEIAHLTTWNKHKNTAKPHGDEWKNEFKVLMQYFLKAEIFPTDVLFALKSYMFNPAAASCTDDKLMRVLRKYDSPKIKTVHVEELPLHSIFKMKNERYFVKGEKIRKRYKCKEIKTNLIYLFSPLAEVFPVTPALFPDEIDK